MRPVKRVMMFAVELGTLLLGFVISAVLAGISEREFGLGSRFVGLLFLAGLVVTVLAFVAIRRRTRPWKIEYEAAGWVLGQAERNLHPHRARVKRLAGRVLVWVPSILASGVLFFLPAASHLIRPGPQTLGPYRVHIPWTLVTLPMPQVDPNSFVPAFALVGSNGGFGVTPFWKRQVFSSEMGFGSRPAEADSSGSRALYDEARLAEAARMLRKEFQLSGVAITCLQYIPSERWRRRVGGMWHAECETPVGVKGWHFYAWFRGSETDLPAFYAVVKGAVPITR